MHRRTTLQKQRFSITEKKKKDKRRLQKSQLKFFVFVDGNVKVWCKTERSSGMFNLQFVVLEKSLIYGDISVNTTDTDLSRVVAK